MKICILSNLYTPIVSGSSTQSSSLARELEARGHDVVVISTQVDKASATHEIQGTTHIYRLKAIRLPKMDIALNFPWLSFSFTPGNQRLVAEIIQRHKPNVLHLQNHMFDLSFSALRAKQAFNLPLVVTLHTVIKHTNPFYNRLLSLIDRQFLGRTIIDNCDHLIFPDVNIKEYAEQAFQFQPSSGSIIPYGISPPQPPTVEATEELRRRYGLQNKRVILSLGHVHDLRNRRDLVEAMPKILESCQNTVLMMVGEVTTETPRRIARQIGVEQNLIFTGAVPHEMIPAYLSLADLEAHWLNQEEAERTSLGIASLEAMGAGVTILSAANPDTYGEGILVHDENIILVEPNKPEALAKTIVALLNDEPRRRRIGSQGAKTVETHFSWESVCQKTVGLYSALANEPMCAPVR